MIPSGTYEAKFGHDTVYNGLNPSGLTSTRLTGINAAQLAIALSSNFFLLLNMGRKIRFAIAQPITIIGWYVKESMFRTEPI